MVFLDFQFMRIVFLAMVRATRISLLFVWSRLIVERSPSRQSEGDNGMGQPRKWDSNLVTSFQNLLMDAQSQVA